LGVSTSERSSESHSEPQTPIAEHKRSSSDQKLSTIKTNPLIRINPPERILDNLFEFDDEDRRFGRRVPSIRKSRQKYKEPLPRIVEDEPQRTSVTALVSAPIVELPAGLISSTNIDHTVTPKQDGSTDSTAPQGQTLLHLAARLGHEDIMRMLISETSHANLLLNNRGQTPLLCAIESDSTSTATLLMEQDPLSLTCKDSIGSSVFHYAAEHCNDTVLSRSISILKQLNSSTARLTVNNESIEFFWLIDFSPIGITTIS
jgi:ankyrin repeat protein